MRIAKDVVAIVLAAGLSTRMNAPKMLLPWGESTVLQTVLSTLRAGGIEKMVVVLGAAEKEIHRLLNETPLPISRVTNPNFANGEMSDSLKIGVGSVSVENRAVLIALGDQPQIEAATVQAILERFQSEGSRLIVPSFNMRRGHPWLVEKSLWSDLNMLSPNFTMRDFFRKYNAEIDYLVVDTPSILQDLDTPEDYARYQSHADQGCGEG
ncbi:MAG: nucleotidyltransferase family protein [Chloroflexota bacterium]